MKQILVIDDDHSLLLLMQQWLVLAGHEVVALSDFHAAKNYLAFNVPAVVITDVRLGAFNGLQLLISIKKSHPEVITIALTGFHDKVIRDEAAEAGAHYLVKPIAEHDILQLLDGSPRYARQERQDKPH